MDEDNGSLSPWQRGRGGGRRKPLPEGDRERRWWLPLPPQRRLHPSLARVERQMEEGGGRRKKDADAVFLRKKNRQISVLCTV